MTRSIAALILAGALAAAPAAHADRLLYRQQPVSPQANNQVAQIIGGLAILGALGYTLNRLNDDDKDRDAKPVRHGNGHGDWRQPGRHDSSGRHDRWTSPNRHPDYRDHGRFGGIGHAGVLPGACLRSVATPYGRSGVFDTHCLYRSGVNVSRLPGSCRAEGRGGWSDARAFDARCLGRNGWRMARSR